MAQSEGLAPNETRRSAFPAVQGWAARAALAAAALAAYVALEWVSFIHEHKGVPITPWNPGLGFLFALLILQGPQFGFVLFAGAIIAEIVVLRSSLEWAAIFGISVIIAAGYSLFAVFARRKMDLDVGLNRLRDVFVLLSTGLFGAVLVALLIAVLLVLDERIDFGDVLISVRPLLVGDMIGIAVVTPLVLRLALNSRTLSAGELAWLPLELAMFVLVVGPIIWAIVGAEEGVGGLRLFHLLFLPVVIAAVRHGLDGACVGLAITQLGLVAVLHFYGYDAQAFTDFQIMMLVLSATGLTVGVVVTEREHAQEAVREVEARLREKESEAMQAARVNLVSGTAAALAHEINQPMTAARALARSAQMLLRAEQPDYARAEDNLAKMIAQIDHAGGVVRHMRQFLRRGEPQRSTAEMGQLLEDALALVRLGGNDSVRVELDVEPGLPSVHADRVQVQQVIINLVRNAMEAFETAGTSDGVIRIAARYLEAPPRIEVAVADNGPGVEEAAVARLFEPLTTSKASGFGLGLSICASIIESHGGRIWLHSGQPGATEFRFSLPLE